MERWVYLFLQDMGVRKEEVKNALLGSSGYKGEYMRNTA